MTQRQSSQYCPVRATGSGNSQARMNAPGRIQPLIKVYSLYRAADSLYRMVDCYACILLVRFTPSVRPATPVAERRARTFSCSYGSVLVAALASLVAGVGGLILTTDDTACGSIRWARRRALSSSTAMRQRDHLLPVWAHPGWRRSDQLQRRRDWVQGSLLQQ